MTASPEGLAREVQHGGLRMREVRKEMREATVRRLEHQCPSCGGWYVPNTRRQVYCDDACRSYMHRKRKKLAVPRATERDETG